MVAIALWSDPALAGFDLLAEVNGAQPGAQPNFLHGAHGSYAGTGLASLLAPASPAASPGSKPVASGQPAPEAGEPDTPGTPTAEGATTASDPAASEVPPPTGAPTTGSSPVIPLPSQAPIAVPRTTGEPAGEEDENNSATLGGSPSDPNALLPIPENTAPEAAEAVRSELIKKRNVPPLWVDMEYNTHRTRALSLPPLFIHRTPKEGHPEKLFHADLSLTFGWYSKRKKKRRYIAPLGLFMGSFSKRTSAWGAIPLLMGYKRVGEQYTFGQFPLVWAWGNRHVKNLVVGPFHYHQKTPDSLRAMSGVLVWYGNQDLKDGNPLTDRRYLVAAPFFIRRDKGLRRTDVGVPLYVGGYNKVKGLKHRTLFPFFHWQSNEFGNRRELWTLPFIKRSDKARKSSAWAVPPLLTFKADSRKRSLLSVTPLVWHGRNHLKGSKYTVAGPLVLYSDPRQQNAAFAPLFWRFSDRRRQVTSTVFFPLAFTRKTPDSFRIFTPIAGATKAKDGFGFSVLPALTFVRQRKSGTNYQVVTPLFWHFNNREKKRDTLVAPPLLYRTKDPEQRRFGVPALFTFTGSSKARNYQVVTPLFWHFHDKKAKKHTFAIPPLYVQRKPTGWHAGLPPIFASGSDENLRYTLVLPLLTGHVTDVKAKTQTTISPLFVRTKSPDHRTLGAGLIAWDVKRKDSRDSVLFPLYYRRQRTVAGQSRTLTLTPLGGGLKTPEGKSWVAGPVYGHKGKGRNSFGIVPLVFHDQRPTEGGIAKHTVVPPLYIRRRTPGDDLDMITPLVWRTRVDGEHPRRNLAVVPFYFRQRQPGGVDVDAGLPWFYSRDKTRHTHTLVAGPFFHRLSRKQLNTGIAPLFWWKDSAETRRLISLPLIIHNAKKQSKEHYTLALPLWFDRQKANGARTWMAFPFVVGVKRLHNFTRVSLTPPLYYDIFRLRKNFRFTGFVPLAFRYQKCNFREGDDPKCRYTMWGSFPLFMYGKDGYGRRTHSALGLYYADRDHKGGRKFYTWLGGYNYRPNDRLTWYAGFFGHTVTKKYRETLVLPLFYRKAHRVEDRSTTVVAPPLFISQRKEEAKWFQTALLFWHFRKPHKVTTAVIPPLFVHSHSYAERRLSWLLPFYLRDNHMAKDTAWTSIFPALFVQRRKGEDLDFVQFPLVWHIERGEMNRTVGFPLWWDFRRGKKTTQVIPALLFRRKTADKALNVIGPGLAWWNRVGEDGNDGLHWRALFGIFGGGNENGARYFSLLGGRIKLKPKPVMKRRYKGRQVKAKVEKKNVEKKPELRPNGSVAPNVEPVKAPPSRPLPGLKIPGKKPPVGKPTGQIPAGQPPASQPGQPSAGQPPASPPPAVQPPGQPPATQPPSGQPPSGQPTPEKPPPEETESGFRGSTLQPGIGQ